MTYFEISIHWNNSVCKIKNYVLYKSWCMYMYYRDKYCNPDEILPFYDHEFNLIFHWKFLLYVEKKCFKICMKLKHWLFCLSIIELRRSGGMEFEVWPCPLPATPCYDYSKVLPTPKTGGTTILPPKNNNNNTHRMYMHDNVPKKLIWYLLL